MKEEVVMGGGLCAHLSASVFHSLYLKQFLSPFIPFVSNRIKGKYLVYLKHNALTLQYIMFFFSVLGRSLIPRLARSIDSPRSKKLKSRQNF